MNSESPEGPHERTVGRCARKAYQRHVLAEVNWYRMNGRYPAERIARARDGTEYVIGDFSWNAGGNSPEIIEPIMSRYV